MELKPGSCLPGLCSFLFTKLHGIMGQDLDLLTVYARALPDEPVPTSPWLGSFHISSCHSPFSLTTESTGLLVGMVDCVPHLPATGGCGRRKSLRGMEPAACEAFEQLQNIALCKT